MDLERIFTYHAPFGSQTDRYNTIRATARSLGYVIVDITPPSAEQTLAIRHLQQAVMWANAAIAINEREIVEAPQSATQLVIDPLHGIPAVEPEGAQQAGEAPPYGGQPRDGVLIANDDTLCARVGCGHPRNEHPSQRSCIHYVPLGTPGGIPRSPDTPPDTGAWCGCSDFTLDTNAEAVT